MVVSRSSIVAATLILIVGIIGFIMASNERAMEKCMETQSADVCTYVMK